MAEMQVETSKSYQLNNRLSCEFMTLLFMAMVICFFSKQTQPKNSYNKTINAFFLVNIIKLTLNSPIITKVVCFSRLLKC